jgi:phosphate-selective porin OprO and OprP
MRPARHEARQWICLLGLCGIVAAFGPTARAQEEAPSKPPTSSMPVAGGPSAPPPTSPTSVDQIAERLRATEEMNKKLAEKLERTAREHDEQMRQLLEKYGDLSKRLIDGKAGGGQKGGDAGGASLWMDNNRAINPDSPVPDDSSQAADPSSPVPDSREGLSAPPHPCRDTWTWTSPAPTGSR